MMKAPLPNRYSVLYKFTVNTNTWCSVITFIVETELSQGNSTYRDSNFLFRITPLCCGWAVCQRFGELCLHECLYIFHGAVSTAGVTERWIWYGRTNVNGRMKDEVVADFTVLTQHSPWRHLVRDQGSNCTSPECQSEALSLCTPACRSQIVMILSREIMKSVRKFPS